MREVRWVLQASKPGHNVWHEQGDRVYSGWFHSVGDDAPSPTVLAEYKKAAEDLHWLDVRLIQETRSFTQKVLTEIKRDEHG